MKTVFYFILSVVFIFIISMPLGLKIADVDPIPTYIKENRKLADRPKVATLNIKNIKVGIEEWLNDTMPFRTFFIANYIRIWELYLGAWGRRSILGKNGELFSHMATAEDLNGFLNLQPIEKDNLLNLKLSYAGTQAFWVLSRAKYLLVLIPAKKTLYPDKLPTWTSWQRGRSWYEQVATTLNIPPINFLGMLPFLSTNKNEIPYYNKRCDVGHWNGNGLALAYKVIGERLARWNSAFSPAPQGKYFTVDDNVVSCGPYGTEKTAWFHLKIPENVEIITRYYPWLSHSPFRNADAIRMKDNHTNIVFLFVTDSFFRATHQDAFPGAHDNISPFVWHVDTYIHCKYEELKDLAAMKKMASEFEPNFVVEAFSEGSGTIPDRAKDPYIRILGDVLLNTPGYTLVPGIVETIGQPVNSSFVIPGSPIQLHAERENPQLILPSLTTDEDGRACIMARLKSPGKTKAKLFFAENNEEFNENKCSETILEKGDNYVHLHIITRPHRQVRLRFDPGEIPGDYIFLPIPELDSLQKLIGAH